MTELFPNISEKARKDAETAFTLARLSNDPVNAAKILNGFIEYYSKVSQEENIREFLNFYFNLRMEMIDNE